MTTIIIVIVLIVAYSAWLFFEARNAPEMVDPQDDYSDEGWKS